MADVENMTSAPATDIPVSSLNANETGAAGSGVVELGTSPTQEPSSNSHPHDSEYDTASDLEGDYDDETESDEESETDEDDTEDDEDEHGSDTVGGIGLERSGVDSEAQKKVDEDRSNPQYIPKRGTFYEHDDRTAETEGDGIIDIGSDGGQCPPGVDPGCDDVSNGNIATGSAAGEQATTISHGSKSMKKWQPASGGDRWSHDRFEASEQAPKTRDEILQSYGYDIRSEYAAPRARRRRRYGRGPMKYSRNWEDEQAYLKASNKERKPPRPQDFPALNERSSTSNKVRRPRRSVSREEKENRRERRNNVGAAAASSGNEKQHGPSSLPPKSQDVREREPKNRSYGRANGGHSTSNRQNAMEFKQKSNRGTHSRGEQRDYVDRRGDGDWLKERLKQKVIFVRNNQQEEPQQQQHQVQQRQQQQQQHKQQQPQQRQQQQQQQQQQPQQQQQQQPQQQQQQPQAQQHQQQQEQKRLPPQPLVTSNLSQRLQQVQQRNDPSHVGSVQMHSLASHSQQQQLQQQQKQQQQQQTTTQQTPLHAAQQQQQQQQEQTQAQQQQLPTEQRNGPKRYSRLWRSQHEATQQQQQQHHLAEQQQIQQQLQLPQQQQQQQQQQQSQLMLQDPHMLMQIAYQQQELQAQLQTLQLGPAPLTAVPPPQSKQHVPSAAAYPQVQGTPYYVASGEPVPVPVPVTVPVPVPQAPYVNPANTAYLPTAQAAVAYAQAESAGSGPPQQAPQAAPPTTQTAQAGPPSMNYHQNYNTVGGTTYFVPPAQAATRPAALPQRRPTNAIPILPPSEKHKTRSTKPDEGASGSGSGSGDNIDHIIDNMFVQRPAFQPPPTSTAGMEGSTSKTVSDETNSSAPVAQSPATEQTNLVTAVPGQE